MSRRQIYIPLVALCARPGAPEVVPTNPKRRPVHQHQQPRQVLEESASGRCLVARAPAKPKMGAQDTEGSERGAIKRQSINYLLCVVGGGLKWCADMRPEVRR